MARKFLGGKPTVGSTDVPVVLESRTITATAPLTIAGTSSADLSADRTIAVTPASTSAAGVVQLSDSTSTNASTKAATEKAVYETKLVADAAIAKSLVTTIGDLIVGAGSPAVPTRLGIGASTYVLTSNGTTAAWALPAMSLLDTQVFTGSTTYTKPTGAKVIVVEVIGSGGGGGGGGRQTGTNAATGGAGGSGGGFWRNAFAASEFDSSITVTIATGGTGGAGQSTATGAGTEGSVGGESRFGPFYYVGGRAGLGGLSSATNPARTDPSPNIFVAGVIVSTSAIGFGAGGGTATSVAGAKNYFGGGGGAKGGNTAAATSAAGGTSHTKMSDAMSANVNEFGAGTGGGAAGVTEGNNGGNGSSRGGGAGGGRGLTVNAGNGGNGATPGGGGGGGGGAYGDKNGGTGGTGGDAQISVWVYG